MAGDRPLGYSKIAGQPFLHVGAPNIGSRETFQKLVDEVFASRWFTNGGAMVQELERRLSEFLGVKHCILVCNGTVGLQIACHALELEGEVIVPGFTFVATAHALQWERVKPVFADIDPRSHVLDPDSVEERITPRTSAIVGVHTWGRPCNPEAIQELADKHGLVVMYDAAHAFGCRHDGRAIGGLGRCEVFSFHATKFFHTFEGGAITTNEDALAHKLRLMKNFGFLQMDKVIHLGTNGKMSEVHAAMGLANLDALDSFVEANQGNYREYESLLASVPGISLLSYDDVEAANFQYVVIEVDEAAYGCTRDELFEKLLSNRIRARRYFFPGCHKMEPYASLYPEHRDRLPNTDAVCERVLCLPTGTAISTEDVRTVCSVIAAR